MNSRIEIEQFCRSFLNGDYQQLHGIVSKYDEYFARINIQFTVDNFLSTFNSICSRVFTIRPATSAYVLAVLGLAMAIDKKLNHLTWYRTDMLVVSMTNILVDINFNPNMFTSNRCILF